MEYKKNQVVTVTITDMDDDGNGIGKIDGYILFIKDTVIGDAVEAKIIKVKKNYSYAIATKIITPSADRVPLKCPVGKSCGGCQLQALSYESQLQFKYNKVFNDLVRIGGVEADYLKVIMEPVVGMENPWNYRNKSQYPVGLNKDGEIIAGFYAGRTHSIISFPECHIASLSDKAILDVILKWAKDLGIRPYDETSQTGLLRHILIRTAVHTGEIMVCLIINGESLGEKENSLISSLKKVDGIASVCINVNKKNTNVIMGDRTYCIYGKDKIEDIMVPCKVTGNEFVPTRREVKFLISARSFYQVNPVQTQKLYSIALDYAGLTGNEEVWDLYCGIGTISLFMASSARKVYGVEVVGDAIRDAKENAAINGIENAEFIEGKAEEILPEYYEKGISKPDVIMVDPPRKGCDEKCLDTMVRMAPSKIVYVSCNPASLARDIKFLMANGYELKKVRPVDMFGHTVHVESCVLLERVSNRKADSYVKLNVKMEDYYLIKDSKGGEDNG